jgi:hypothetical protein
MEFDKPSRASGIVRTELSDEDIEAFLLGKGEPPKKLLRHVQWMVISQTGPALSHAREDLELAALERICTDALRHCSEYTTGQCLRRRDDTRLHAVLTVPFSKIVGCSAGSFVYKRVCWTVQDFVRTGRKEVAALDSWRETLDEGPRDPNARQDLERVLNSLEAEDVELLYYKSLSLSYEQIAGLIAGSPDAIKKRYQRLVERLKERFPELSNKELEATP